MRVIVAARCNLRAPSAAYARALMASKHPYTAERLRQKARASADGARSDHPTVADLSCEYLWPPLLSVSSVIVFFLQFTTRCECPGTAASRTRRAALILTKLKLVHKT